MVLFTSLNTALTGLQAQLATLQTIGHNISNATTPGYSRQEVDFETNTPNDFVRFQIGTGARIKQIRRVIDMALEARLQSASSALGNLNVKSTALNQLESTVNALSGSDIGAMLDNLFKAMEDLSNRPADISTRSAVLEQVRLLSDSFNSLANDIRDARDSLNEQLGSAIGEVNRITREIAGLNKQVLEAENGGIDLGAANDLRDRRDLLVKQLSNLVGIKAVETSRGEMNVLVGSAFLVFGATSYDLTTDDTVDNGSIISTPVFENGSATLQVTDGQMAGIIEARDNILSGFLKDFDVLANSIIYEFNKIHSTGQGLQRFGDLTSVNGIRDTSFPIAVAGQATSTSVSKNTIVDASVMGSGANLIGKQVLILTGDNILEQRTITGFDSATGTIIVDKDFNTVIAQGDRFQITSLNFSIVNGSFDVVLTNEISGTQTSYNITVDLDKLPDITSDTTLTGIATQINAIAPGVITATITSDGKLRIESSSGDVKFGFANDSSGFLAAMGLNTLFTGYDSSTIAVNKLISDNPALLAAAKSNTAGDNSNAIEMGLLRNRSVVKGQSSFEEFYQDIIGEVAVNAGEFSNRLETQQLVSEQLENQRERVSGVSIDEEATKMITHQRAFQAVARYIAVIDSLLDTLINGIR